MIEVIDVYEGPLQIKRKALVDTNLVDGIVYASNRGGDKWMIPGTALRGWAGRKNEEHFVRTVIMIYDERNK